MTDRQCVLTIAAASGRVAYVLLKDMHVSAWGLSRKASNGPDDAALCAARWIEWLRPDVVVTEKITKGSKKGARTRSVTSAITAVADRADILNVEVVRGRSYPSKYAEAHGLARDFPELAHLVPKRRKPWDTEPRTTVYFEALALALAALGDPNIER